MLDQTSTIISKVWGMCNPLRDNGVSYGDYLEQLTYLIFLKMSDEYSKPPYKRETGIPAGYTWADMNTLKGAELEEQYKATLEKLGIFPDEIETAGKATLLLDRLAKRRVEGLTTPKQIRFLEGKGFQHVGQWQFATAKHLIDRIAANGWRVPGNINPSEYVGV